MNNSKMTRKFERLLFNGVPEQPEPIWERNDNSYVSVRHTGKSQSNAGGSSGSDAIIVGTFILDNVNQREIFIPENDEKKVDISQKSE